MKPRKSLASQWPWFGCAIILAVAAADAYAQEDIRSWDPPPKEYTVTGVGMSSNGMPPPAFHGPNLGISHYFWLSSDNRDVNLWPFGSLNPGGAEELKKLRGLLEEGSLRDEFPVTAAIDGYGANYVDLKRGDLIPLLGQLFYVARGTELLGLDYEKVDGAYRVASPRVELHRLEASHPAYKRLGFPVERTYSFPYHGDVVRKWYHHVSAARDPGQVPSEQYPKYAYDIFRGNKIIIRNIRNQSNDDPTSRPQVELAIVPLTLQGEAVGLWPEEEDFHWYSVGDELAIPWAFLAWGGGTYRAGEAVPVKTTDLKYYKITNIVLPDSPTIQVQPEDGGAPIECKPIGWVDIDIHGREEPAGKKE